MPRGDGTGPLGKGPGTGWGRGPCSEDRSERYGYGRGFGRGWCRRIFSGERSFRTRRNERER